MRQLLIIITLASSWLLSACGLIYKLDIPQGNIVTQEMVSQLERGMDRRQVAYIMGTPLVVDVFHVNRWDYVYSFQPGGGERTQRRLSLYFENDRLARVEGDVMPAGDEKGGTGRVTSVEIPLKEEKGIVGGFMDSIGLGNDEAPDKDKPDDAQDSEQTDDQ